MSTFSCGWRRCPTLDHLTQARATLRSVRPSGRSPNNAAIYAYIPSLLTKNAVTRANAMLGPDLVTTSENPLRAVRYVRQMKGETR